VSQAELAAILAHARAVGLVTLGTAIAYGDSERRLGESDIEDWQVISKLPPVSDFCTDVVLWVRHSVLG
jgi:hypothetical protein